MITLHDVQSAIIKVLVDNGNTVTANEIDEGFSKPTFFIDLYTNSTEVQNMHSELVNIGVDLKYIPLVETREECIMKTGQIKEMFLNVPLKVNDRFLSVNNIIFDTEGNNLLAYFELEFFNERNIPEKEYEKIENIEIGGVDSYGSSTSNN